MPLLKKPVKSLQNLCLSPWTAQVDSSCEKIQALSPSLSNFNDASSECRSAVQALQDHLRLNIPPIMWEEVFKAVQDIQEKRKTLDNRILFFTFLYPNIKLSSLKIGFRDNTCRPLILSLLLEPLLLINLQEVDLEFAEMDLIADISRKCTNLEVITLPSNLSDEIMEEVIRNCKKLKEIRCEDYCGEKTPLALQLLGSLESLNWRLNVGLFATLDLNRKLKLLRLQLGEDVHVNPEHLTTALELCPDLVDLALEGTFNNQTEKFVEILENLAASRHKLIKIDLTLIDIPSESIEKFMSCKGMHLTHLALAWGLTTNSLQLLQNISKKCQHLVDLEIYILESMASEELVTGLVLSHDITFRKLKNLDIGHVCESNALAITIAYHCMLYAEDLTSLSLLLKTWNGEDDVDATRESLLMQLFSTPRAQQLKSLTLAILTSISMQLAKHIYTNCTQLTELKIGNLSLEAQLYVDLIKEEVKETNLDFRCINIPYDY